MTYTVTIRPLAEQDLAEAEDWYQEQRDGLGTEFRMAVDLAISRLVNNPLAFPTVHQSVRRAVVKRFPYLLYFAVRGTSVTLLACLHSSRSPRVHRGRTR